MAEIKLYGYRGIPQVINKNLTEIVTLNGTFRQPMTLMNPVFEVGGGDIQNQIISGGVNYVGIGDRYYYLVNWSIMPNTMVEMTLHLDVLMTYKSKISELMVMLDRSQTTNETTLIDHDYPLTANRRNDIIDYAVGFSDQEADGTYILVTSQSGYTPVTS